jgi:hypothetical protein
MPRFTKFDHHLPLLTSISVVLVPVVSVDISWMVDSSLTMSTTPLVDLVQAIHLPSHRFLLTTSANPDSDSIIDLYLFAPTPASDTYGEGNGDGIGSGSGSSPSSTSSKSGARSIITWQGQIDLNDAEVFHFLEFAR